jgi:hypothetical protein
LKPNRHRNLGAQLNENYLQDLEEESRNAYTALISVDAKKQSKNSDLVAKRHSVNRIRMAITTPYIATFRRQIAEKKKDFFEWALTADELVNKKWYRENGSKSFFHIMSVNLLDF